MDPWKRSTHMRMEDAKKNKEKGSEKFKEQDYKAAGQYYINALRDILPIVHLEEEEKEQVESLKSTCYSNLAACQLKLQQFDRVLLNCNKSLDIDKTNVKGLYRRACVHLERSDREAARDDIKSILKLEPGNTAVKELESKLSRLDKKTDERDAKIMKGFLGAM